MKQASTGDRTVVLDVRGLNWATEKSIVESTLDRLPGVTSVEANPVAQTATVSFDPASTWMEDLVGWVRDCGYHCNGESVPAHVCSPQMQLEHEQAAITSAEGRGPTTTAGHAETSHQGHGGHAGHGDGMSMASMVRDMRNRFAVAALLSIPILLFSPIGRDVLGFEADAPFGLRDDVLSLLLSLPVVFYSAWIFFFGAWSALRARTLDMMVLVAVAVGAGWVYSVGITLAGGGEVFYEAATVLTAFVLLGHWFEMRARGGANDAIRTLLDLAPAKALVIREGETVEVATSEVMVDDLLLVRPGSKVAVDGSTLR